MDWSKIKTIFIITFLILDVYLLFQFMKIRDANKYEVITETSLEDKLKADEIKIDVELPKAAIKNQYLSAQPGKFSKSDAAKLKGQKVVINESGTTITADLENPIQLSSKFEPASLADFLKEKILYGEDYQFWEKDDEKKTITYFQQYDNFPLYQNMNGMIIFTLNEDNQIMKYQQTHIEGIEKLTAKEDVLLQPMKAIETLYQKGVLKPKSKITKVELGYSTLIQLAASQVLAPTWRLVVDDKENLYVNAFEGQIIEFGSNENLGAE